MTVSEPRLRGAATVSREPDAAHPDEHGPDREVDPLRARCVGMPPLSARLESWQRELCTAPERLQELVSSHGSPLNLHHAGTFGRNLRRLRAVAETRGVGLEVLFARKADKALVYVDRARDLGAGVDTASEAELRQSLERGCPPELLVCTAAIKTEGLVRLATDAGVTIAVDNHDELDLVQRCSATSARPARVVLRLGGFLVDGTPLATRFGIHPGGVGAFAERITPGDPRLRLVGLHFHLDGYDARHRIAAVMQALPVMDALRARGHPVDSLDIGGGLPMSYLDDEAQWTTFQDELHRSLLGERDPITYRNHGLGLQAVDGEIRGRLATYPYFQQPTAVDWLAAVLDASVPGTGASVARELVAREVVLRCEPGRSLLDGCGLTVARVEHRKEHPDGSWTLGLGMNRTQCSTSKADHAVDPLLLPVDGPHARTPPIEGYLTGAYCTESELLTWRRLRFPYGVARGDLVVFPNTAGYLMHFLESRSHQFPLAINLVVSDDGQGIEVDAIDR